MKTLKTLALMLVVFLSILGSAQAASNQPDYMYLGRQEEKLGNYEAAANQYSNAANAVENYGKRAEIIANEVVRMFAISSVARETLATMLTVRRYDPKRANALLAKHEKLVRKQLVDYVSRNRAWGFPDEDQRNEAISYFHQFYPTSREALAEDFYKLGVAEGGGYMFYRAIDADPKVRVKIAKHHMGDTTNISDEELIERLIKAGEFMDDKTQQMYADKFLPIGKKSATNPSKEATELTTKVRAALTALKGNDWVQANLPETVVYYPGKKYSFTLEAGEQTPNWIIAPYGIKTRISIACEDYSDFVKVYDNGDIVGMNENHESSYSKMKFVAKKKSYIEIEIQN